ncbi:MAG: hypothetical protein HY593_03930 [Candidatus Omnitrophica bacterium]|nr:hypothetical protein [Candidatus Omnitrophota bacterium]
MAETRTCPYCKLPFTPGKYSPRQKACGNSECRKKRQRENLHLWRLRNPNYFKYDESKGAAWLEIQRQRSKAWREKNPDKVRSYRKAHLGEYRAYMREYMRRYRQKRRERAGQVS